MVFCWWLDVSQKWNKIYSEIIVFGKNYCKHSDSDKKYFRMSFWSLTQIFLDHFMAELQTSDIGLKI